MQTNDCLILVSSDPDGLLRFILGSVKMVIVFVIAFVLSIVDVIVTAVHTPRPTSAHEHGKSSSQLKREHDQAGDIWACVWNDER